MGEGGKWRGRNGGFFSSRNRYFSPGLKHPAAKDTLPFLGQRGKRHAALAYQQKQVLYDLPLGVLAPTSYIA